MGVLEQITSSLQNDFFRPFLMPFACLTVPVALSLLFAVAYSPMQAEASLVILFILSSFPLYPPLFSCHHALVCFWKALALLGDTVVCVCLHPVSQLCAGAAALELRYYLGRDTLTVEEHTAGSNFALN